MNVFCCEWVFFVVNGCFLFTFMCENFIKINFPNPSFDFAQDDKGVILMEFSRNFSIL